MHAWDTILHIQQHIITKKLVKRVKKVQNLCLIMYVTDTISINKLHITLPKLHVKFQPDCLKIFQTKVKRAKNTEMMPKAN